MNASIVLIKYCLNETQTMIQTIRFKNNLYDVEGFKEYFVDSSECQTMLAQLESDVEHYKKLLDHLISKFPSEYKINTEKEKQVYDNAQERGTSKATLLNEMEKEFKDITSFYMKKIEYIENLSY